MRLEAEFQQFWQRYPRKVGKLAARKAYEKARTNNGATQTELLAGIDAYIAHKPAYADYAHPASWLNAGRWMDEWGTAPVRRSDIDWRAECSVLHDGTCRKRWDHEMRLRDEKASA